jgi:hypothetical protein
MERKEAKHESAYVNAYVYRDTLNGSLFVVDEERAGEDIERVGEYLLRVKGDRRFVPSELDTYIAERTDGNCDHHFVTVEQLGEMIRSFNVSRG